MSISHRCVQSPGSRVGSLCCVCVSLFAERSVCVASPVLRVAPLAKQLASSMFPRGGIYGDHILPWLWVGSSHPGFLQVRCELFVETVSPPEESPDKTLRAQRSVVGLWAGLRFTPSLRPPLLTVVWLALLPMPVLRPEMGMSPSALLGEVRAQSSFPGHVLWPAHHCCSLSLL